MELYHRDKGKATDVMYLDLWKALNNILVRTTSLSLNWRDIGLMDRVISG